MDILEEKITTTLKNNYMPYAMSVIISRAIPEIDGFKPSHRKLLYTMYKMNLLTSQRTKSSNVVGQTMKLNPHGDSAIYETMVRLTRGNEALLHPYIDSKGSFGKIYSRDTAYAAARYTEVKLAEICNEIFSDIDKNTVNFVDNYDGTMKEPTLLPVAFPNILVNSNQGIAVGMASNIASFNLGEVCDATVEFLKTGDIDFEKTLIAPDFSTGGIILYDKDQMIELLKTGRGSFRIRSKYKYDKKNNCIDVYEIPYTTTCEAIIEKIRDLIKAGKIKEIVDVRDEIGFEGFRLTIDLRRGVDPGALMHRLFKMTPLEDTFSANFNVLIGGTPYVLGVKEIIEEWCKFRINCIKRRTQYDLDKANERLHLLLGLEKILLDIDKAIRIIRNTQEDKDVIPNLMEGFGIDRGQAEFIAEIKLRNLNKEYILKRTSEIDSLKKEIEKLNHILAHEEEVKKIIINELAQIKKKYAIPRKSEILNVDDIEEVEEEIFIDDYNVKIFLTEGNYLKKISLVSLRSQSEHKLKDNDRIICEFDATNKDEILLFSNKANVYKLRCYEIPDTKASALGEFLINLLGLDEGERIIYSCNANGYTGHALFFFENGKGAKVPVSVYKTKGYRKKLTSAYSDKSPICAIFYIQQDEDFCAFSESGKALVFNSSQISEKTTRTTQGVQVLKLKKGSKLSKVVMAKDLGFNDIEYYRTKNIPAAGYYVKESDMQISLF